MVTDQATIDQFYTDTEQRYKEQQDQLKKLLDQYRQQATQDLTTGQAGEDLRAQYNRLGLLNSGAFNTGLANKYADIQKNSENALLEQGLNTTNTLQDIQNSGLERLFSSEDQQANADLNRELANQQARNNTTNSLIGAGGQLGSLYLASKLMGGGSSVASSGLFSGLGSKIGGLFSGGAGSAAGTAGSSYVPGLTGAAGLAPGTTAGSTLGLGGSTAGTGVGASGTGAGAGAGSALGPLAGFAAGAVGGGYLGQKAGNAIFKSKTAEKRARKGASIGSTTGAAIGSIYGPLGSTIGGLIGGALGQGVGGLTKSKPAKSISNNLKSAAKQPLKYVANAPKQAVKSVTSSAKGTVRSVKKLFCFLGDTLVTMLDGSKKKIKDINIDDKVMDGGKVYSVRKSSIEEGLCNYKGIFVTESHAVYEEGVWKRVGESKHATKIKGPAVVYSIVNENHRMKVGDITFADEHETDDYEMLDIDESIEKLNEEGK